jgi:hypothetical protein
MADDFRSQRMPSPEGRGNARRAWDAYSKGVREVSDPLLSPFVAPLARRVAIGQVLDLAGFWMMWHLEGGFDGLLRLGMSRSAIYRRLKLFRKLFGQHVDEVTSFPGVTLDLKAYWADKRARAEQGAAERPDGS